MIYELTSRLTRVQGVIWDGGNVAELKDFCGLTSDMMGDRFVIESDGTALVAAQWDDIRCVVPVGYWVIKTENHRELDVVSPQLLQRTATGWEREKPMAVPDRIHRALADTWLEYQARRTKHHVINPAHFVPAMVDAVLAELGYTHPAPKGSKEEQSDG